MTTPIRTQARIAGALYLLCIAAGFFAELSVRAKLIVWHDPAATASRIMASPMLFRMGFFADLAAMALGVVIAVILYNLLKPVSRSLALLDLVMAVLSNIISICGAVFLFAPLKILGAGDLFAAFAPAQLQALALGSLQIYELSYSLNLIFFGLDCLIAGYLMFRSGYFPKVLGVLLPIAGLCYITNSIVNFMPAGFGEGLFPWVLMPSLLAETSLALWLLIVGVNAAKWSAYGRPGVAGGVMGVSG